MNMNATKMHLFAGPAQAFAGRDVLCGTSVLTKKLSGHDSRGFVLNDFKLAFCNNCEKFPGILDYNGGAGAP